MDYLTLASVAEVKIREQYRLLYNVLVVLTGSFLIAAIAQLEFILPFSPVPITGQTFAVLVVAMALGAVRGGLAVLTYLIEGCAGLPVFAGGASGIAFLFGPTGGYLVGFLAAAVLVGFLAERGWDRNIILTLIAMYFATIIIFCIGLCWLGVFVPYDQVYSLGLWPFIPGAIIQIAAAAILLPTVRKFV
ncbi:biotin transporter BioY [bacterium]|nr:biotin transporter BioY [bacterium]MBU1637592.1 biotin transporter BioY [bacterium]MBU1921027.1 biotin transporter BioY [bacterium]